MIIYHYEGGMSSLDLHDLEDILIARKGSVKSVLSHLPTFISDSFGFCYLTITFLGSDDNIQVFDVSEANLIIGICRKIDGLGIDFIKRTYRIY